MKAIKATSNEHQWPRQAVETVECRKRDLVVRVSDWSKDKDEPGYDVEVYIGGVYDFNESKTFTVFEHKALSIAKQLATSFAASQIAKLL